MSGWRSSMLSVHGEEFKAGYDEVARRFIEAAGGPLDAEGLSGAMAGVHIMMLERFERVLGPYIAEGALAVFRDERREIQRVYGVSDDA